MHLEFECADGMSHPFDIVTQTMGEVVHRVDAPGIAGMMMLGVADSIEEWVTHPNVWRGHVDPGAQGARAVGKFACFHALEQIEAFCGGAIAVGAILARPVWRASV